MIFIVLFYFIRNILFVGSSNCTEIGLMGTNNESQWQCWVLDTRPELPFRLDKQMYPLGMSLDVSSQIRIKQSNRFSFLVTMSCFNFNFFYFSI